MFTTRKLALAAAVTAALAVGSAQAAQVSSGYTFTTAGAVSNFTMLTADGTGAYAPYNGYTFGGTNNVTFTWDGTMFTSSSDYTLGGPNVSNATISSPTVFFGSKWTAHDVQIFGPGSYTFASGSGPQTMTVGAGQFGAHMLFNWATNADIDVVNVWNNSTTFSGCDSPATNPAASNCLWSGISNTVGNSAATVFRFASSDGDGDGTNGSGMVDGPFFAFNANFNLQGTLTPVETVVPVPAAVWLFGSGLLGLVGIARRKKGSA